MCFHSQQTKKAEEIAKRFGVLKTNVPADISGIYNGFEFPKTPVITNLKTQEVQLFNWGLIPNWAETNEIRKHTLNARIETLTEKPSFKNITHQRCLIISTGFYEWQWRDQKGKNKVKYQITSKENEIFTFAGLWSEWVNPLTHNTINSYSIITTEANKLMAKIHNTKKRMPLIVPKQNEYDWLNEIPLEEARNFNVSLHAENMSNQQRLF